MFAVSVKLKKNSFIRITTILFAISLLFMMSQSAKAARTQEILNLDENCIVNILNRTVQVNEKGRFALPNVPSFMGRIKARATCTRAGLTESGETDYFSVVNNAKVQVGQFYKAVSNIPESISLLNGIRIELNATNNVTQLLPSVNYPDGTQKIIRESIEGVNYTSTNSQVVTVNNSGVLTAVNSGVSLISVRIDGVVTTATVVVSLTGDLDGDGIPDGIEQQYGMDPNDPIDAHEDQDKDGLSALEEYQLGTDPNTADTDADGINDGEEVNTGKDGFITNPLLADSDGDGINDGLETASGSDPTNAQDYNFATTLQSFTITPADVSIVYNAVDGEQEATFEVSGQLVDGTLLNLTSASRGTSFASSNLGICSLAGNGITYIADTGTCQITASNSGFTATANVTASRFDPAALNYVTLSNPANSVDLSGNYAFVATNNSLAVVNISNPATPVVSTEYSGIVAHDVKVAGKYAYVAADTAGLIIFDVSNPASIKQVAQLDTAGIANDLVLKGQTVYLSDSSALSIIDVSNKSSLKETGRYSFSYTTTGVAVNAAGNMVAMAAGTQGVYVFDTSQLSQPFQLSQLPGGNVIDLAIKGNYAFLADYRRSMTSVDLTDPRNPILGASTPRANGGLLNDIALWGDFAFGADVFFVNGVPIVNTSVPMNPAPRQILDFSQYFDDNGTGIAVTQSHVYLTAANRLYVGQYRTCNDADNDGLCNEEEEALGTDPLVADTDLDGLSDGYEVRYGINPLDGTDGNSIDTDADGLGDATEVGLGLNPEIYDTDSDGLSDGDEVNLYGTQPLVKDTDGDGISDGDEIKIGVLDPLLADTDGDGISDGEELLAMPLSYQYSVHKEVSVVSDIARFKNEYYISSFGSINIPNRLHKTNSLNETFKEVVNGPNVALNYTLLADNNWLYACHQHGVVRFDGGSRVENNANKSAYPTNQLNFVDNQIVAGRSNNSGYGNAWEILPRDNRFSTAGYTIDDRRIQGIYWGHGVSAERFKDWVYFGGIISSSNRESTSAPAFYGAPDLDISDGVTGLSIVDLNTGPLKHIGSEAFIKASPDRLMVTLSEYPYYSTTADNISWNNQQLVAGKVFVTSRILFHEGAFHTLVRTNSDKSFEIYRLNTTTNQLELNHSLPKVSDISIIGETVSALTFYRLQVIDGQLIAMGTVETNVGRYGIVYHYARNPAGDDDKDGLSNFAEFAVYNTDPTKADTDGDGISDGDEIKIGVFNPLLADSNANGVSDSQELLAMPMSQGYAVHKEVAKISDIAKFKNELYLSTFSTTGINHQLRKSDKLHQTFQSIVSGPNTALNTSIVADNNWLYVAQENGLSRFDGGSLVENNSNVTSLPSTAVSIVDGHLVSGRSNGGSNGNVWEIIPLANTFQTAGYMIDDVALQNTGLSRGVAAERFKGWIYFSGSLENTTSVVTTLPALYGARDVDISNGVTGMAAIDTGTGVLQHNGTETHIKASSERLLAIFGNTPHYSLTSDNVTWLKQELSIGLEFVNSPIVFQQGTYYTLVKTVADSSVAIYQMNVSSMSFEKYRDLPVSAMIDITGEAVTGLTYEKLREIDGKLVVVGEVETNLSRYGIIHTQSREPAADDDDDGLSNYAELVVYHTDPDKTDTDGDGISDGTEIKNGTDPLIAN